MNLNLPVRPARPARAQVNIEDSRPSGTHIHQEGSHFGSTQVTGGAVLQGNFVGVTINSTARPDFAGQFSYSLLEPVMAFVPRPLLRGQIRAQFCNDATDRNTKTLVVWGLGGAGKTQLVLDYVREYRTDYKATFWIEAGRKESLERDFVNLYQTLFGVQMVAGQEAVSVDRAVMGVKSWFSGQRGPWLIVFDGADAIENEMASEYINIKHFIPDVASLHVIVTSRSSTARDMTPLKGVQVGDMDEAQAMELFYRYSRLRRDDQDVENEVRIIVKELGHLALAVTLASTYVGRTPRLSDIKAYLPEYRRRRRELLKRKPERLIHQYSESVLTTWETSYHAINEQSPQASTLMTMLSFFCFDDIFLQLFGIGGQVESTESIGDAAEISSTPPVDIYKLEECFEMLQRYLFVQWKEDQQSYAMHKLVHAWGYDRLTEDEQLRLSLSTLELVVQAIDGCSNTPDDKLRLVPHIMANFTTLAGASGASDQSAEGTLYKLSEVGLFMRDIGRLPEGYVIWKYILNKTWRILGEEHPDTIGAMNNLANILREQGQPDEATRMSKEVLEKSRRILGEEHLFMIRAMSNLVITLRKRGQLDEATRIKKEVLEKSRRILGEEHPDTIRAMHNLSIILREQGQLDEATRIQKEVLEKSRRIFGEEHPDMIRTMSNLVITLRKRGQLDEATRIKKEVLEKRRRILGEEHPDTIRAMHNLSLILREQGQLDEAARIGKEVLEKSRRILGEEHPDTIGVMYDLAITLEEQGQLDEATRIEKEVLEKRRRILDKEHPDTIRTMHNLSIILREQGQLDEAMRIQKEVLEKSRRILGEEHPNTIRTMSNLVITLRKRGQLDEATRIKKEVLEKSRRILVEEHPDTIGAMYNLIITLGAQGQLDEAISLLEVVVQKMKRIHGDDYPHTKAAIRNLTGLTTSSAT